MAKDGNWKKALEANELADGEVTTVQCAGRTLCLTKFKGEYAALDLSLIHI